MLVFDLLKIDPDFFFSADWRASSEYEAAYKHLNGLSPFYRESIGVGNKFQHQDCED